MVCCVIVPFHVARGSVAVVDRARGVVSIATLLCYVLRVVPFWFIMRVVTFWAENLFNVDNCVLRMCCALLVPTGQRKSTCQNACFVMNRAY